MKAPESIKIHVFANNMVYEFHYFNYICCDVCRGAALPMNTPGIPCIFDPHGRAGICGDWLLGSSLESAALSGMALANHVSATQPSLP